jgi:hypothetical protein
MGKDEKIAGFVGCAIFLAICTIGFWAPPAILAFAVHALTILMWISFILILLGTAAIVLFIVWVLSIFCYLYVKEKMTRRNSSIK